MRINHSNRPKIKNYKREKRKGIRPAYLIGLLTVLFLTIIAKKFILPSVLPKETLNGYPVLMLKADVYTCEDGTSLDLWQNEYGFQEYRMKDGTILLTDYGITNLMELDEIKWSKKDPDVFADLSEKQKNTVIEYLTMEVGCLYNIPEELEYAWQDTLYRKSEHAEPFTWSISQQYYTAGSNHRLMMFGITVSRDGSRNHGQDTQTYKLADRTVYFDRAENDIIDVSKLFNRTDKEVIAWLLDGRTDIEDGEKEKMKEAFTFDYITLSNTEYSISFPKGVLGKEQTVEQGWGDKLEGIEECLNREYFQ